MDSQKRFLDYMTLLVSWKRKIMINILIISIVAVVVSLIVPKWYKSYTTILPPVDESSELGLSGLMKSLPMGGSLGLGGLGAVSEETSRFIAIMNSRTMKQSIIDEFNLQQLYKKKTIEETIKELNDHISLSINDDGSITVYTEARTPYFSFGQSDDPAKILAKNMANYIIRKYDEMNKHFKIEKAGQVRSFIEERYQQNLSDLFKAEEAFKNYQKKHGTIALPEQTAATIGAAAEITAEIIARKVELGVLTNSVGKTHSEYSRVNDELLNLKSQLSDLQGRKPGAEKSIEDLIFLPLDQIPDLSADYVRLYREVIIQTKLLEFLLPQFENSKIQELRDTPTVQVLDDAVLPEKKARPRRALIVVAAAFFAIFCFVLAAYISVNFDSIRENEPDRHRKIVHLLSELNPRNWNK